MTDSTQAENESVQRQPRVPPAVSREERAAQEQAVLVAVREIMSRQRLRVSEIKRVIRSRFEGLLPGVLNRVLGLLVAADRKAKSHGSGEGAANPRKRIVVALAKGKDSRRKPQRPESGFGDEDRGDRVFPDITTKIARSEWTKRVKGQMRVQCIWCGNWVHERKMPEHQAECRWFVIRKRNPDQFRPDWTGGLPVSRRDEVPFPLQSHRALTHGRE
jgi:hypothetical protein